MAYFHKTHLESISREISQQFNNLELRIDNMNKTYWKENECDSIFSRSVVYDSVNHVHWYPNISLPNVPASNPEGDL